MDITVAFYLQAVGLIAAIIFNHVGPILLASAICATVIVLNAVN